jgi:hypothetical protein
VVWAEVSASLLAAIGARLDHNVSTGTPWRQCRAGVIPHRCIGDRTVLLSQGRVDLHFKVCAVVDLFFTELKGGSRIESPWGPFRCQLGYRSKVANRSLRRSQMDWGLRIQATGLPQLGSGAPTFRMHVYGSSGGGLLELLAGTVTVAKPGLTVGPEVVGGGVRLIAVLETPFGALLTPADVSV